jgi:hypothetical protein
MPVRRPRGPIEDYPFPTQLEARVITPGPDPHLHGLSVERDLALHYRFSDVTLLALTREAPDEQKGRAFDIALQFLAPLSIAEAPTHAAVLARICGARTSSILGAASITLAERARFIVSQYAPLLHWLREPGGDLPSTFCSHDEDDRASVLRLERALGNAGISVPSLRTNADRFAAIFIVLEFAGLREAGQLEAVLVFASLIPTFAEANAHAVASFREYPMNLPAFVYEEES